MASENLSFHWHKADYFALLLRGEVNGCSALEYLVDDLHQDKERTVYAFLDHAGSEDFLWSLVRFLGHHNPRIAGNAAFILGTIAESEMGRRRVISLAESRHAEKAKILPDLVSLLSSTDSESVMNAAGTIGTLAESEEGREWLLRETCTQSMIERVTALLTNENAWTASNAALVLARLTISERGCSLLLDNHCSKSILSQLVESLGTDEAGRGMNAAFAIGRLCDTDKGREMLLTLPAANKMVTHLGNMLCSDDTGASKNACFAVSCLAASADGHRRLLENVTCDKVMNSLASLLSSDDDETCWFAAMTLHTFSSLPKGCIKLRELPKVMPCLQRALHQPPGAHNEEILREVEETLAILKYLDKPSPPVLTVLGPREVKVTWVESTTRSGLDITYKLFSGNSCIYSGSGREHTLSNLNPSETVTLRLRACVPGDDSPLSDTVSATTEEDVPEAPSNLTLLARTATQLKVGWEPPAAFSGPIRSYYVFLDKTMIEHTSEHSCIITRLQEQMTYTVKVCAATSVGKGAMAVLECTTADLGDHCPGKPALTAMGRSEIHVTWTAPQVPLGRITRYDVSMNNKVIYAGTELHCTARHLHPNTEYTFIVTVITNEGPQDSRPSKKKTAKDEYDSQRAPLYVPPLRKEETKPNTDQSSLPSGKKKKKRTSMGRAGSRNRAVSGSRSRCSDKKTAADITDKPASAGSRVRPADNQQTSDTRLDTSDIPPRIRTDVARHRGDNSKTPSRHVTDSTRANSFAGLSSNRAASSSTSANRVSSLDSSGRSLNSPAPLSSQHKQRASVSCTDQEKLVRTLTSLNIATFDPMLPPSMTQRSSTFIGQRRQNSQFRGSQNQYTVVSHGNAAPFIMEIPHRFPLAGQSSSSNIKSSQVAARVQANNSGLFL